MLTTFLSRDDFNTGYWTKCGTVKGFPKEITVIIYIIFLLYLYEKIEVRNKISYFKYFLSKYQNL